jgi:hypothetical protein
MSTFTRSNEPFSSGGQRGPRGESAYEVAVRNGFNGTEQDWLESLANGPIGATGPQGPVGPEGPVGPGGPRGVTGNQGPQGAQGPTGQNGIEGPRGQNGSQGPIGSTGPTGSQGATGPQGPAGQNGRTPYVTIGVNGNWFIDSVDTGLPSRGAAGTAGLTAYQVAAENGFTGTEEQWLASLKALNGRSMFLTTAEISFNAVTSIPYDSVFNPAVPGIQIQVGDILVSTHPNSTGYGGTISMADQPTNQLIVSNTAQIAPWGLSLEWQGSFGSAPANPQLNWGYYNIYERKSYIWNGLEWKLIVEAPPILRILGTFDDINELNVWIQARPDMFPNGTGNPGDAAVILQTETLWVWDLEINDWYDTEARFIAAQGPQGPDGLSAYQIAVAQGFVGDADAWLNSLIGATGPTGIQGPVGSTGEVGATGPVGATGFTGLTGATGPIGATGLQGPQGTQGIQGVQGVQGFEGPTGPQGIQGVQGLQGLIGATGIQGPMGPAGEDGAGVEILGSFTSTAQLPTTGSPGQAYLVNGVLYVYDNTLVPPWRNAGNIRGPEGEPGIQGPQGPQGPQGNQGPQGPIGATGPQGVQGIQGATGPTGATGPIGATGQTGAMPQISFRLDAAGNLYVNIV